ncbi:D-cysteine desulfhydrase [Neobacillus bataviensis LMG 21833]|uniref:D-cysteine desulfhydrase n=1 Tax=Neobacillus bataviensis LMG 21833 TaxID=1117379 RepID=K6DR10_9BACI|nr:D-cysteine desulfhydrase [Neobacillus bataviensis]EKN70643.1 D-cysteine desulfhydrase [Neobacillus bataviensis LMG 21833]
MRLASFPRRHYTSYRTPIEKLERFSESLGGPTIYIKRDDQLGLTLGGNKTRKLEFLVADALEKGADTLITCGAIQSNHCRLTLSAAVKEGLKCHLILKKAVPQSYPTEESGNYLLYHLLGAENTTVVTEDSDMQMEMQKVADKLAEEGRTGYMIPAGGSNETGMLGYIACAQEILEQAYNLGVRFDHVVAASGSGGTHAGLVLGFEGFNSHIPVIGINVGNNKKMQEQKVYKLVKNTATYIGLSNEISRKVVTCFDDYVGPGYSHPTLEMIEAVKLLGQTEGILLDPVYTGKAMAGLIDLIRKQYFKKEDHVLFIHTGGTPALYAFTSTFLKKDFEERKKV